MNRALSRSILLFCLLPILSSCTGIPKGISPVDNFELERYLGKWYEIARLDHRFERGLQAVTAEYSMTDTGNVKVFNSGFSLKKLERVEAEGKAKFVGDTSMGHLKVSFFGPFYASYVVFEIDDDYQNAFISGNNEKSLWFLSRAASPAQATIDSFVARASELGFPVDELIFVDQTP